MIMAAGEIQTGKRDMFSKKYGRRALHSLSSLDEDMQIGQRVTGTSTDQCFQAPVLGLPNIIRTWSLFLLKSNTTLRKSFGSAPSLCSYLYLNLD